MNRTVRLALFAVVLAASPAGAQQPAKPPAKSPVKVPAKPPATAVAPVVSSAATAPAKLPPVTLSAERDSFHIMVNARAVGVSVFSVTPTAGGFVVRENTSMPSMGMQNTEVTTDAAGHPLVVKQNGLMAGQTVGVNVNYANGRAKGTAKLPNAQTLTIDAVVPVNVVDDNMLQAILPNLPWAADAKWELPVFSGGMNQLSTQTLVVTDEVPVSLPSGSVNAYRAELRSEGAVVAFYVSKDAPHKVLKIAAGGAPFEYVRVN